MIVAKQVADLITFGRSLISVALVGLGFHQGEAGLPLAAMLMLLSWISDVIDGPLARRSRVQYRTWIGDHDLEVDMSVASGLLIYLVLAHYVGLLTGILYAVLWIVILRYWRENRALKMLYQAPIYGWFLWVELSEAFVYGIWLVVWILTVIWLTWPRFPREVIPGFLGDIQKVNKSRK